MGRQCHRRRADDTPGDVSAVVFNHYGPGVTLTVPPNAINLS
jgi:hypothetical protein